tara:strand:- start:595 stop:1824 length:1230 start_codon:yes stop_codon:yes gene_type:complete
MKKTILHISSRYSYFGTFLSSKKYFEILSKNKKYKNIYYTGRIDFETKNNNVKPLRFYNNFLTYKIFYFIDRITSYLIQKNIFSDYWSNSTIDIPMLNKLKNLKKIDLIILYWINDGFLSIQEIGKILKLKVPVIWRFSDMWPMTGGCHYSYGCRKFTKICKDCPKIEKKKIIDLAKLNFNKKLNWNQKYLNILTPSTDLKKKVQKSRIFKKTNCETILNNVDVKFFKPIKNKTSKNFNILVGPFSSSDYFRKGYFEFVQILKYLEKTKININIKFHIFGGYQAEKSKIIVNHGFVSQKKLKKLFNSSHLYLFLSKQDNSPNTVAESLASGVPIITFKNNGTSDLCINDYNSKVLKKFDPKLIVINILKLRKKVKILKKLSINSRKFAIEKLNVNQTEKKLYKMINKLI